MNMISQLPQVARFTAVGERRLPVQKPLKLYTLAERVENAHTENAMRAEAERLKKIPKIAPLEGEADEASTAILDVMDGPMTSKQIAELMGASVAAVKTRLALMHRQGFVKGEKPEVKWKAGMIWRKVDEPQIEPTIQAGKAAELRDDILSKITGPTTTAELADHFNKNKDHMREILRGMEIAGRIKRDGYGPKPEKGAAPVLWVKA